MTTFLILLFFAVIFFVAGGVLLYFRNRNKEEAALMGQTETSETSDVPGLAPGTVQEDGGIGGPMSSDRGQRFLISHRSEEALGQSLGKTVLWLGVGGVAALVVGVVLLVVGVFALAS